VFDALEWKPDIPTSTSVRHIATVDQAITTHYRYELRGSAGRWFITREPTQAGLGTQMLRTRFYPSQQTAREVFTELISE
jgi:hypothetical protein